MIAGFPFQDFFELIGSHFFASRADQERPGAWEQPRPLEKSAVDTQFCLGNHAFLVNTTVVDQTPHLPPPA
jgi:hypothetical protein